MTSQPLAIDLYCGLGGWSEGLLAEGYDVIGFDIERHEYGEHRYPAQLVLQDVLTIDGAQFRDAALIVASPPCQAYSYRAMPWSRAKALPPPDNSLFEACFRIQQEACAAAGHHIPLVVENVRGAQPWVGRSRWNYGSFHLWGDVPALMPMTKKAVKVGGIDFNGYGTPGYKAQAFNTTAQQRMKHENNEHGGRFSERDTAMLRTPESGQQSASRVNDRVGHNSPGLDRNNESSDSERRPGIATDSGHFGHDQSGMKNTDGSWFAIAHNTTSGKGQNPDGRKTTGHVNKRDGYGHTRHLTNQAESDGVKQHKSGRAWFADPDSISGATSSKFRSRKAASAMIAKIPLPLSQYIASVYWPTASQIVMVRG